MRRWEDCLIARWIGLDWMGGDTVNRRVFIELEIKSPQSHSSYLPHLSPPPLDLPLPITVQEAATGKPRRRGYPRVRVRGGCITRTEGNTVAQGVSIRDQLSQKVMAIDAALGQLAQPLLLKTMV